LINNFIFLFYLRRPTDFLNYIYFLKASASHYFLERFPYKEEVTGSNPVAPTRVFQKSTLLKYKKPHKNHTIVSLFTELI